MTSMGLAWLCTRSSNSHSTVNLMAFVGLLTVGADVSLFLLPGLFSSYCVALSSLDKRVFDLSYSILFYLVWLSFLRGLTFSEEETREERR